MVIASRLTGFALNRFFCPYSNEAVRLLEEDLGSPAQIDRVAQETLGIARPQLKEEVKIGHLQHVTEGETLNSI